MTYRSKQIGPRQGAKASMRTLLQRGGAARLKIIEIVEIPRDARSPVHGIIPYPFLNPPVFTTP